MHGAYASCEHDTNTPENTKNTAVFNFYSGLHGVVSFVFVVAIAIVMRKVRLRAPPNDSSFHLGRPNAVK